MPLTIRPLSPQAEQALIARVSANQYIRDISRRGLERVGTSESVAKIRPLIESPSETVRRATTLLLETMTFKTWQPENGVQELRPADFDIWWKANRQKSRRDWAMDALGRPGTTNVMSWWPPRYEKIRALEFLDAQRDPALAGTFRSLAADPDWSVRIKAALGRLTGENLPVDCEAPDARAAATTRWLALAKPQR